MAEPRLPADVKHFLRYFEATNRDYPDERWQNGAELSRRWLAMQAQDQISQAEIDEFLELLQAEPNKQGSGWWDLDIHFRRWARSLGFRVASKP